MIRKILIIVCLIMTNLSFSQSEEVRKDVSIHNDSIGWKKSLSNNNVIIRLGFRNIFFWGCWSFINKIEFLYPYNSKLRFGLYGYHTAPDILHAYQVDKKTVYSISTALDASYFYSYRLFHLFLILKVKQDIHTMLVGLQENIF